MHSIDMGYRIEYIVVWWANRENRDFVELYIHYTGLYLLGLGQMNACDIEKEAKKSVGRVDLAEREFLGVVLMLWH